jgi:rod shape-determining protein MreC
MVTNRDDFVIAIRSAFLQKGTQQRFSLISLILISLFLLMLEKVDFKVIKKLRSGINEGVYRISYVVSLPENLLKSNFEIISDHFNHYNDYIEVNNQLTELKSKDLSKQIVELENKKLKKLIDDFFIIENEIFAKVLIDKSSPFLRSVVLNKGSKDNMKLGMAVLDGIYLIGKIVEVNYSTSRVLLLSDLNAKIPVTLEPGDFQAIMSGTGNNNGVLQYSKESLLKEYEKDIVVYTSGSGGLFKSGIPIGTIKKDNNTEKKEKFVDFYVDFTQLKYAKVLSFSKEKISPQNQEQAELESIDKQIEEIKKDKENISILLEQKKIALEIREKIENENEELKKGMITLSRELALANEKIKQQKIQEEEMLFLKLNLVYGPKCKKNFYNQLYKVGTPEYKACVLNKGPQKKEFKKEVIVE